VKTQFLLIKSYRELLPDEDMLIECEKMIDEITSRKTFAELMKGSGKNLQDFIKEHWASNAEYLYASEL
jgi:hypothetical protein